MPRKNPTSVVLNKTVQKIKDELSPVYGLKNILSAGLTLFGRLSADDQKKIIAEVNSLSSDSGNTCQPGAAEKTHGQISKAVHVIREMSPDGSLSVKFLSDEDRQAVEELAELIHPKAKAKKADKDKTA